MGSRAPDPYGKDTELSQEYSFLFVLGTVLALNCKYLCASKQSRACVRSIGSRGGGWGVGGQALLLWTMGRKQKTQKKKKPTKLLGSPVKYSCIMCPLGAGRGGTGGTGMSCSSSLGWPHVSGVRASSWHCCPLIPWE